jgi:hypothetical protein
VPPPLENTTVNDLVKHALQYVENIEAKERAEAEAQIRANEEKRNAILPIILKDLEGEFPAGMNIADYVTVDELTATEVQSAALLLRLPDCEFILFWVHHTERFGWRLGIDPDKEARFNIYPAVEEWWDCGSTFRSDLIEAIAEAHRRYVHRMEHEAKQAVTLSTHLEPPSLEERMVAALEDIASTLNGIANKYLY